MTARKKTKTKPKPETACQRRLRKACVQMKHGAVPTAVAVTTSVMIGKISAPIVPLALIAAGGWAWWKGYRIRIQKPEE